MLVAQGGMGQVYRATDSALERTVAVKLLSDRYAGDEDARARFRREALAAARLSRTPNVVTVFDVAEHRGRPLIVMEYLEGGSVYERLRDGARVEGAGPDLARAGGRRPRPGARERRRPPGREAGEPPARRRRATSTSPTSGSRRRAARTRSRRPEWCSAPPATSPRSRLGASPPRLRATATRSVSSPSSSSPDAARTSGDTPTTEAFGHLHAEIPSATALDPSLPASVDDVFRVALAKEPEARPANALALVSMLREALAEEEPAAAPAPTLVYAAEPAPAELGRARRRVRSIARDGGAARSSWVRRRRCCSSSGSSRPRSSARETTSPPPRREERRAPRSRRRAARRRARQARRRPPQRRSTHVASPGCRRATTPVRFRSSGRPSSRRTGRGR